MKWLERDPAAQKHLGRTYEHDGRRWTVHYLQTGPRGDEARLIPQGGGRGRTVAVAALDSMKPCEPSLAEMTGQQFLTLLSTAPKGNAP